MISLIVWNEGKILIIKNISEKRSTGLFWHSFSIYLASKESRPCFGQYKPVGQKKYSRNDQCSLKLFVFKILIQKNFKFWSTVRKFVSGSMKDPSLSTNHRYIFKGRNSQKNGCKNRITSRVIKIFHINFIAI